MDNKSVHNKNAKMATFLITDCIKNKKEQTMLCTVLHYSTSNQNNNISLWNLVMLGLGG